MSMLDSLPWAGDILAGRAMAPKPGVRVRILHNSYWHNDDDNGKLGWALYSRGGVTFWVNLDDGTSTQFNGDDLEVIEAHEPAGGG